jgi:hypothetical protein
VLSIDPDTGALSSVPGSPFGLMHSCGSVAADPSGPLVYAGSALETADTPATVSVLSMQATGALVLIGETTIPDRLGVSFITLTH